MPPAVPVTGKDAVVQFTPTGGTLAVFKNSHVTILEGPPIFEAFNTSDGILRGAGLPDASGTVEGFVDALNPPSKLVRGGAIGVIKINLTPTEFYQCTAIIGQVTVDSAGINEPEKFSFPWMMQSGTLTTPA